MATFGNVLAPNKLFDLADADRDILRNRAIRQDVQRVDDVRALAPEIAAGGQRREAALDQMLAIDPTRGAQVQSAIGMREQRAQAVTQEEEDRVNQFSRVLAGLPEEARAPAYQAFVAYQKERGLLRRAPDQYPGHQMIQMRANMALSPAERAARAEQDAINSALGRGPASTPSGAAPAGPSATPASIGGGDIRAQNQAADALRQEAYATLQGPELERRIAEISAGRAQAANGIRPGTPMRANEGVGGVYRGLPAPTGAVPVIGDVRADAGSVIGGGVASRYPGAADVAGDGVIPESVQRAVMGPNAQAAEAFIAGQAPAAPVAAPVEADPPGVDTNVAQAMLARLSQRSGSPAVAPAGTPAPYTPPEPQPAPAPVAAPMAGPALPAPGPMAPPPPGPTPVVDVPEVQVAAEAPLPLPLPAPPGAPQAMAQARPAARTPLAGVGRTNALLGGDNSADRLNGIALDLARGGIPADSPEARNIDRAMGTSRYAGVAAPEAMPAMGTVTRENLPDITPAVRVAPTGARQNALLPPAQPVVPFSQSQVPPQPSDPAPQRVAPREITPAADGRREIPVATPAADGTRPPAAATAPDLSARSAEAARLREDARRLIAVPNARAQSMASGLNSQAAAIEAEVRDARDYADRQGRDRRAETRDEENRRLTAERERRADASAQRQADASERAARAAEDRARRDAGPEGATESERKASSFLERMEESEQIVGRLVRPVTPGKPGEQPGEGYDAGNLRDRVANNTPFVGNYLQSEQGQRYMNAASEWTRAKLRFESGAVIGIDEAREEARTYFPMPGDSEDMILQKKELRETAMRAMRRIAGRAAPSRSDAPRTTEVNTPRGNDASPAPGQGGGHPPLPSGFTVVE